MKIYQVLASHSLSLTKLRKTSWGRWDELKIQPEISSASSLTSNSLSQYQLERCSGSILLLHRHGPPVYITTLSKSCHNRVRHSFLLPFMYWDIVHVLICVIKFIMILNFSHQQSCCHHHHCCCALLFLSCLLVFSSWTCNPPAPVSWCVYHHAWHIIHFSSSPHHITKNYFSSR